MLLHSRRLATYLFLVLLLWPTLALTQERPIEPGGSTESVADTAKCWSTTREYAAEEAFQAAAADDEFFYAISSTQIAKYSRANGQRVAVSQGDAQHLNSGFLWEGNLYCAHSNYPQRPEHSQIKVLDTDSMQLTTFKDFADYGGSLTWVVRHAGNWWCNFAYYGAENNRTVLVQFSENWQERGRWHYPEQVVRELGQYSLSGGIWQGNDLIVTGHDAPVLFRLRLPNEGQALQLLRRESIPFTGQGIATDPKSSALVGIHRAKRLVLLASPTSGLRLRVLSYNIHHAEGVDGKLDVERIARVIRSARPDIVALQEVDRGTRRSQSIDEPAELARLTNMHVVFGQNLAVDGGQYGNAVLSRFPIERWQNHALPSYDNGEQRGVLEAELLLPDAWPKLRLLATHLDHRRDEKERLASAEVVNRLAEANADMPALLVGDLNAVPDSRTLVELAKHWQRANAEIQPTIPVDQPTRQIDYVMFRPLERWQVVDTQVLAESTASDHRGLLAVLDLLEPTTASQNP